jgi:TPR repeat protein
VEAAGRFSLLFFDVMGDMGEACSEGDALACNPANYVIGGLAGVVFMPMGFVIGLASPEIEKHHCAKARQQKAAQKEPLTEEEKRARLWARAVEGDIEAQYEVGEQLFEGEVSENQRAAWYWYCRAAHQRHAGAQYRLGGYYRAGREPVSQDLLQAYLWYELAADQHVSAAAEERAAVAARLSAKQVAHAERRAAEWQPKPDDCSFDTVGNTALSLEEDSGDDR